MRNFGSDWYKKVWSLDIKDQSWVEGTGSQVDFIEKALELKPGARILDLACGFGRHSLELARRGYSVVGADITQDYVDDANKTAAAEGLDAHFICSDIREVRFEDEFDAVMNLADGAIGYLENDEENLKSFDVIAKALRHGGKHLLDVVSGDYADEHFPCKLWDDGEKTISLSCFEWDRQTRIMLYSQTDIAYGEPLFRPELCGFPTRLYTLAEIESIMNERGMSVIASYSDYYGKASSSRDLQLMTVSVKK